MISRMSDRNKMKILHSNIPEHRLETGLVSLLTLDDLEYRYLELRFLRESIDTDKLLENLMKFSQFIWVNAGSHPSRGSTSLFLVHHLLYWWNNFYRHDITITKIKTIDHFKSNANQSLASFSIPDLFSWVVSNQSSAVNLYLDSYHISDRTVRRSDTRFLIKIKFWNSSEITAEALYDMF